MERETVIKLESEMSEWFQVKFGVHKNSILNLLLLAIVVNALTDEIKTIKDFLYGDGLVLVGDDWKEGEREPSNGKTHSKAMG